MINLQNTTLIRGNKTLFENANLTFYPNEKIGIVGKNGCGKSSLFLLLLKAIESNQGDVHIPSNLSIMTVEQEIPHSEREAIEYVIDADLQLRNYEKALQKAQEKNEAKKMADLYEKLTAIDGFTAKARASKILKGLGFDDTNMHHIVNHLSGGWRMRLNIARALFVQSDVLLLDEPTNHLDLDAVIWLEKWLNRYAGLLLLISHDREFLDHIVNKIAHLEHQTIKSYKGNYSQFEKLRAEQLILQKKQFENQQKHIAHLESFITRFKAKATKAKQAQSRVKALEKMQKIMPAHLDSPFTFSFKKAEHLPNPLLNLEKVSFGYTNDPVLQFVSFQLHPGDRIGLLGKNGAGKSTFIQLLAQKIKPQVGKIAHHLNLKIGYFEQHTIDSLMENENPLNHLVKLAPNEKELTLRNFLGSFDFKNEMALAPIKNFSGGEKARLALALIIWQSPNLLLLDEPTNHLDIDMRQALILALQHFEGAIVLVSHDRFLLEQIVDEYYLVSNQKVQFFKGDLKAYETLLNDSSIKTEKTDTPKKSHHIRNEQQKNLNRLEKKMEKLAQKIAIIDEKLIGYSNDPIKHQSDLQKRQTEKATLQTELQTTESDWLSIAENV